MLVQFGSVVVQFWFSCGSVLVQFGSVWVQFWFSFGSVLVQCWFSFGSVGSVLVQLQVATKLNHLNQNRTKTEPKLNQHWATIKQTVLVQFRFSVGSVWFSVASVGYVLVQLKAEPRLN